MVRVRLRVAGLLPLLRMARLLPRLSLLLISRLLIGIRLLVPRLLIRVLILVLRVLLAPGRLLSWPHGE
ncbi:hypothetical protein NRF20_37120 [Streptomyces sp. R-74717]|uniref:hypothetical protein n=1 Tax=Streptomyces sp. R-74717 TaxID=2969820 RepID=UPI0039B6BFDC